MRGLSLYVRIWRLQTVPALKGLTAAPYIIFVLTFILLAHYISFLIFCQSWTIFNHFEVDSGVSATQLQEWKFQLINLAVKELNPFQISPANSTDPNSIYLLFVSVIHINPASQKMNPLSTEVLLEY